MDEREKLTQAIEALEAQRAHLGDAVVDAALGPMREKLAALALPGDGSLRGERKRVTIVLADVKGSTALSEQLDIEDWVEVMNHVFQILETEIHRFGGEVNQFRGDGLLAFFGARTVREDDPVRGVLAALAMQTAVRRYAVELAERSGVELLLRVGVNTGEVVVARVGDRQYSEHTAMGRSVALAARMESAAEPGTVLVSEHTYRLAHAAFTWQPLDEISVKGIAEPVPVYRPLAQRAQPGQSRGLGGLVSPLVGRSREFGALQAALRQLLDGAGGVVTLVGEAGLGKSRLVAELRALAKRQGGPAGLHWVEGRCVSYGDDTAYGLWFDVLRAMLGLTAEESPARAAEILRDRVEALCPAEAGALIEPLSQLLAFQTETLSPATAPHAVEDGGESEGMALKQRIFEALAGLLAGAARRSPLVIVCEDLHWADASSLEVLARLFPLAQQVPLLLLCVFRPEPGHGCWRLREAAAARDVTLAPLAPDDAQHLLSNLLHVDGLPSQLRARILTYAEGNPFYVEEIVRALLEEGAIAYDAPAGRWRAARGSVAVSIPDTVQGVLAARIDRLSPEQKRVLQLASVIGRIIQRRVLAAVAPSPDALDGHLRALQEAALLRERAPDPAGTYIFKHHLTQQAAYHSLLEKDRRAVHRQVAETLKRLFADRLWEQASVLAYHWEHADEPSRAIPHLIRAADTASYSFANAEALSYLHRALRQARAAKLALAEAEVLYKLSYITRRSGDYAQARAYLDEALPIYQGFGNQRRVGLLLAELGTIARRLGDYAGAAAYFEQTLHIARLVGNRRGEISALNNLGHVGLDRGALAEARQHLTQALKLSRLIHFDWGEAAALAGLGDLLRHLGDLAEAWRHLDAALRLNRAAGDRRGEGTVLARLAFLCYVQGEASRAEAHAREALALAQETGYRAREADALTALGHALAAQARPEEACAAYERAVALRENLGQRHLAAEPLAGLARLAQERGDVPSALARVEAMLACTANLAMLEGLDLPLFVYAAGYRGLAAAEDGRAAELLAAAHDLVQRRAAAMPAGRRATLLAVMEAQFPELDVGWPQVPGAS